MAGVRSFGVLDLIPLSPFSEMEKGLILIVRFKTKLQQP